MQKRCRLLKKHLTPDRKRTEKKRSETEGYGRSTNAMRNLLKNGKDRVVIFRISLALALGSLLCSCIASSSTDATLGLQLIASSGQTLTCEQNATCPSLSVQLLGSDNFSALPVSDQTVTFTHCSSSNPTPFTIVTPSVKTDATGTATTQVIAPNSASASDCIQASVSGTSLTAQFILTTPTSSTAPSVPVQLSFTSISSGSVTLNWTPSTGSSISYAIWRGTASGGATSPLASGVTTTNYVDNTVKNGTTYYYQVQATNLVGETSGRSTEASVTPSSGGCNPTGTPFGGGSGSGGDPYLICSNAQLANVSANKSPTTYFNLVSSLDLSSFTSTHPLGAYDLVFTGTFDGQNNILSNWSYSSSSNTDPVGLFPTLGNSTGTQLGTLKNLLLSNFNITVSASNSAGVGALVGIMSPGPVTNVAGNNTNVYNLVNRCFATGSSVTVANGSKIGGLVGILSNWNKIQNAAFSGSVNASGTVGGLVGTTDVRSTISNSYSAGSVAVTTNAGKAGGLVGAPTNNSDISQCYSTASVTANALSTTRVGGLIGFLSSSTVVNSYASGNVTTQNSSSSIGGLIGGSDDTGNNNNVTFCYSSGLVTSPSPSSNTVGGLIGSYTRTLSTNNFFDSTVNSSLPSYYNQFTSSSVPTATLGRSTTLLKTPATFIGAAWSTSIWNLTAGAYPTLY